MLIQLKTADEVIYQEWSWWNGEILKSAIDRPIAFDTETELIRTLKGKATDPRHVPTPSLAMAYDGERLVAIHPTKLGRFFQTHRSSRFCGHNLAFDFWVVYNTVDRAAKEILWQIGDKNGYSDTMILDMLLQLGKGKYRKGGNNDTTDSKLYPTDLGTLAEEYECGLLLDKRSEYRLRFGEWIGLTEREIDSYPDSERFLSYALADAIATFRVYQKQRKEAVDLMVKCGWKNDRRLKQYEIRPDALDKFGPLSEYIQVKASIVLAELSRTPIRIDQQKRAEEERKTRERYQTAIDYLTTQAPDLIKRTKPKYKKIDGVRTLIKEAQIKYTAKAGVPQMDNKRLAEELLRIAKEKEFEVPLSKGKKKGMSLSAKDWEPLSSDSLFVKHWITIEKEAKLLEFLTAINAKEVYSRYNLLMRTGRTSAGAYKTKNELLLPSINIQQIPRGENVRNLFLPPDGYKWFSCDYGYLELRSLAAVCKALFGWSKLGEAVIEHTKNGGVDPHQRTAAVILGINIEEFLMLPKIEQKEHRQKAKACFHEDTEILTPNGWIKIKDVTLDTEVAQYWPGTGVIQWTKPYATIIQENKELIRVRNSSVDIRVTPDHRMVGFNAFNQPRVVYPEQMNKLRGIWNAGEIKEGKRIGNLKEEIVRQIVCIQADGSITKSGNYIRFGFTKKRKIERFRLLFPNAKESISSQGTTTFIIEWKALYEILLDKNKRFNVKNLLKLPIAWRNVFLDELQYWDGHSRNREKRFAYSSICKDNIDAIQAIATITGRKSSVISYSEATEKRKTCYTLSIKKRDYTRGNNFTIEKIEGRHKVYCVSVPSGYIIVRDKDKSVITGNCNFGYPGGLGSKKFTQYAKVSYGVNLTEKEAKEAKKKWLQLYPEIKLYLGDKTQQSLQWRSGRKMQTLSWLQRKRLSDFIRGEEKDREKYSYSELESIWSILGAVAYATKDDTIIEAVEKRKVTSLIRSLITYRSCTLTGRVRDKVKYTDGCNTPFQGLAADGAKVAMWNLMRKGFKLLSFIHDAFDTAVSKQQAHAQCKQIEKIMNASMEEVFGQDIPVACEGNIGDYWEKA